MLMKGDLNRIIESVNQVTEGLAKRIDVLEEELKVLKGAKTTPKETLKSKKEAA